MSKTYHWIRLYDLFERMPWRDGRYRCELRPPMANPHPPCPQREGRMLGQPLSPQFGALMSSFPDSSIDCQSGCRKITRMNNQKGVSQDIKHYHKDKTLKCYYQYVKSHHWKGPRQGYQLGVKDVPRSWTLTIPAKWIRQLLIAQ